MAKSVTIDFNANVAKFSNALDKATKDLNKFQSNTSRIANQANKAFGGLTKTVIGLAGTAGIAAVTKQSLDFADAVGKASEKTGFSITQLQELRFAADQNGASFNELDAGLARFTKRLGLARAGTGAAADTYKKLGIDLKQANEQVFNQVVNTLAKMDDQTNRLALTTRLFGDDAQKLELVFRNGTTGLDQYAEKARSLGLILNDDLVRGAEKANDELSVMKQVVNVQTVKIFTDLAPAITSVGQAFADSAPKVAAFFDSFKDVQDQGLQALEDTAREAQEKYSFWLDKQEDYLSIPTNLRTLDPGYGEYIDKQLNAWKTKFEAAINRIRKIREDAINDLPVSAAPGVDTSHFFEGVNQGAKDAAQSVQVLRDDLDDILDIYEREEAANAKRWAEAEAGINKTATATTQLKIETEGLDDSWKDLGFTFSSAFEDAIVEGNKLSDVVRGLAKDILRITARKNITEPLGNIISGGFSNLFGFANGGSFMVGGAGGTDSQLVAFRASPNERVTIETPAQQRGGGGITIHNAVDARGSTNPMETEQAVFRAVRMAVNESVATMRDLKARGSLPEFDR